MENTFNDFAEIPDVESMDKPEDKLEDSKRVMERLNKMIKKLHKQNKLFKQLCRRSVHTVATEPAVEEVTTTPKRNFSSNTAVKRDISFLEKLGDAFLKALPSILRTIATVAVPLLFGLIPRGYAPLRKAVT